MNRSQEIASRVREVLLDGEWIARTNIKHQIENASFQEAVQKVETLHTIAELTFHLNYFIAGLNNVFAGGTLEIRDKYSWDMPPIKSAGDWESLRETYLSNATSFVEYVEKFEEKRLDEPFIMKEYGSYLRNIEGVIEHSYYHLGQMALISKLIRK